RARQQPGRVAAANRGRRDRDRYHRTGSRRHRDRPCRSRSSRRDQLMLFYRVVHWILTNGSRALWRVKVVGIERIPEAGGFVLAPSHRSMMDIPLAAIVTKRRI